MTPVAIVDYGAGNLASVVKALRAAGASPTIVQQPSAVQNARGLVIPGVGHFQATVALDDRWRQTIQTRIEAGTAVLGICLGMQWLHEGSDEAPGVQGFGAFPGRCFRLTPGKKEPRLKVPHVGWNTLTTAGSRSTLLGRLGAEPYAYFTHTFAAPIGPATVATTEHGERFSSIVEQGRVFGVQWHPEKSGDTGLMVLRRWVAMARVGR